MRILILSTVHYWNDPRIFHKQACTLAKEHEVILAAVGEGPERMINGVRVRLIGTWTSRFDRVRLWLKAYREIFRWKPDAVHFHDPELALLLLPLAFLSNKRLVCDVHEHPSGGYGRRPWIPKSLQRWIGGFFYRLLRSSPFFYSAVLLAEDGYTPCFPKRSNIHVIRNYALLPDPDIPFLDRYQEFDPRKELKLIYVGCLMEYRGAFTMVEMVEKLSRKYPGVRLDLVGRSQPFSLESVLQKETSRLNGIIKLHGYVDWNNIDPFLRHAHIGLIPLRPDPNLMDALATKLYDYMVYGLPFIASDFPLWRRFLEENPGGIPIDCTDADNLVKAIADLVETPDRLRELSNNGYHLVREKFTWKREAEKLLRIYRNFTH